ncbi:malto-oligosyltrehalose synthase [Epidermidibacterium keratini]|uniref:Malto-oligosyltrehalose synthase n=1 Tax=Epidermidibacterium keratini TaxID=1891644 RepID=A0A7L4YSP2_9ACTN|nr:malto-oligosyltrehalose synthase [Epidermidibacterium keratini]QHC01993.1 malto-oligosyltrehalose synthase [Epidermidibacterium keratini]
MNTPSTDIDIATVARLHARAPRSTYRLHLRGEPHETLWSSIDVLDYVAELGADAIYLSPILQAVPDSTHAYDVVDPTIVDAARGGEDAFIAFTDHARSLGLKVILDVVPNHMGVQQPRANPYWWSVLREGRDSAYAEFFDIDWDAGKLLLPVLSSDPAPDLDRVERDGDVLRVLGLDYPIADGTGDGTPREVLERQHYRLTAHDDRHAPTYRRFFNVTGLAAIRQENPDVFEWANRRYLDWVAEGRADGLRLDHIDGLAHPDRYLADLQQAHPGLWVVPEMVLERDEKMPLEFACAGTTGYDVMAYLDRLIVDPAGEQAFIDLDGSFGMPADAAELIDRARRECVAGPINADVERLARMATEIPDARAALDEILVGFRAYRTFLPDDGAELSAAVDRARAAAPQLTSAIDAVAARLADAADPLAIRFQQTSGSLMGIAVESWVFFRFGRLTSLAEIGGTPLWWSVSPDEAHAFFAEHDRERPLAMTTLATHDTKRGEDVRARLAVLSELADDWAADVRRWFTDQPPASYALGSLLLQALVGAWPVSDDDLDYYVTKAAREFGEQTSWSSPNVEFEATVRAWIEGFRSSATAHGREVAAWVERIQPDGWSNSLTIKALQLAGPGVPDVYRGSEGWNLDLVDPLNRKTVDYERLRDSLARSGEIVPIDETAGAKVKLVSAALRLRRERPEAFAGYRPVKAEGEAADHLIGFARDGVIAVGTRLPVGLQQRGGWGETTVTLDGQWRDTLTGVQHSGSVRLADLLVSYPVAVLVAD